MLETEHIKRFASADDYASYCRALDSRCDSNGVNKGENNRKNSNKYPSTLLRIGSGVGVCGGHELRGALPRAGAGVTGGQGGAHVAGGGGEGASLQAGQGRLLRVARRRGVQRAKAVWIENSAAVASPRRGWPATIKS